MNQWTPYILAGVGLVAYVLKQLVSQGNRITAIEASIETASKGAAMILNSANPAPPEIRNLLRIHSREKLTEDQRNQLMAWLRAHIDDQTAPRDERGVSLQLLGGLDVVARRSRPWWRVWG